ncbi:DUF3786 domain-containing protein [Desulfurivibrio alkaliphilus]|uniref:Fe-S cluster domain protein n=1 Tax=Desulfurivibrio alkaliphilus (strain DSM 19089 / UNIQEM U267 / AHT2) TaxID=589865 RepID=D6Z1G5_DESAT|nr:DUF3786 domain-containing protein [Desulfurivibrio alkaliphilus]ADH85420.1 Fe-S cluster domain protein [Desulfurivibrio alkaliphilus AHT 2]
MNPLELFKKTPQTNCGQCGHPACLAFAAAVTKGGEDPAKCPFLDLAALGLSRQEGPELAGVLRQRELELAEYLKSQVAGLDFAALAEPLGCRLEQDGSGRPVLVFNYLGQETRLNATGVWLEGVEPEDPRDRILLYSYVRSGGGPAPTNQWIGLESLPNTISKVRTLAVYGEQPLARLFHEYGHQRLLAAGLQLGGSSPAESTADLSMIIPVLPQLPQCLHFWAEAPEEGFAASAKVLYDARVLDFLDLESLIFTTERLVDRLTLLLQEPKSAALGKPEKK